MDEMVKTIRKNGCFYWRRYDLGIIIGECLVWEEFEFGKGSDIYLCEREFGDH